MRTVLILVPSGEDPKPHRLWIYSAPMVVRTQWADMQIDPDALPPLKGDAGAEAHGKELYTKLTGHVGVKQILDDLAGLAEVGPIYLETGSAYSELVCWEALNRDGTFLTLGRWPISRIAREVNSEPRIQAYTFDGTLRFMAVLSAYGVSAEEELKGLKEAVNQARFEGLHVKLCVVVGEEGLLAKAKGEGIGYDDEVKPLEGSGVDLLRQIEQFRPRIIHFFCHGRTEVGNHLLEFAKIRDRKGELGRGSVQLRSEFLKGSPAMKQVWLATLNCCKMSVGSSEVRSMTHSLVADGGVAAAVGMLEPIDAEDAHAFCRYFYPDLLARLKSDLNALEADSLANPDAVRVIEWAVTMSRARQGLSERHPVDETRPCWTLPALYVRPEPFSLQLARPGAFSPRDQIIRETILGLINHISNQRGESVEDFRQMLGRLLTDPALPGKLG